jgi:hypothetical protein
MTLTSATIGTMRRIATIATLASRLETFQKVLPAILAQVDHVYIYLDGHAVAPAFLRDLDNVTVCRCEDVGDLHASSRFLCLQDLAAPTVVAIVDDDINYPPDYVDRLVRALQRFEGKAVVGVHGRIFLPPHQSYSRHGTVMHFAHQLADPRQVHVLGTGTCAFISGMLDIDPRGWSRYDMDDINLAIEAQRRGLPRVAVARAEGWMKGYAERQPDSLWIKTLADDSEHSRRMRELLALYV